MIESIFFNDFENNKSEFNITPKHAINYMDDNINQKTNINKRQNRNTINTNQRTRWDQRKRKPLKKLQTSRNKNRKN